MRARYALVSMMCMVCAGVLYSKAVSRLLGNSERTPTHLESLIMGSTYGSIVNMAVNSLSICLYGRAVNPS
jgi:hypothetical protein